MTHDWLIQTIKSEKNIDQREIKLINETYPCDEQEMPPACLWHGWSYTWTARPTPEACTPSHGSTWTHTFTIVHLHYRIWAQLSWKCQRRCLDIHTCTSNVYLESVKRMVPFRAWCRTHSVTVLSASTWRQSCWGLSTRQTKVNILPIPGTTQSCEALSAVISSAHTQRHQSLKSGSIPNKWRWPDSPQPSSSPVYADTPIWATKCIFPSQINHHTFFLNLLFPCPLWPRLLPLTFNLKI